MKNILITGANRGIGLALSQQLLAQGSRVIATCRQPQKADALHALNDEFPDQLTLLPLDVTNSQSIQAACNAVQRIVTGLDLLINNAGVLDSGETLTTFDPVVMQQTFDINATGAMRIALQFLPLLRQGNQPKLINVTSQLGSLQKMKPGWGRYSYNSSKAALNMITRMLSFDLAADGITVICIHPGWVQTDMGGPSASLTPDESAAGILRVAAALTLAETGQFFTYSGEIHPW
jgi:NAD(P)-dependent dehydrogenase (short-subunit alcohol dehydrogenase family)